MKWLFILTFIAYVHVPWGIDKVYRNIKKVNAGWTGIYQLTLTNGKDVLVPAMFTVIEEQ